MATLTRQKEDDVYLTPELPLDSSIPAPFPKDLLQPSTSTITDDNDVQTLLNPFEPEAGPSTLVENASHSPSTVALKELMPSIVYVEKSCLMTLNNLLSEPVGWNPIVPDRRHSMPSSPTVTASIDDASSTSALQTLVNNLRKRAAQGEMIEARETNTDGELLRELQHRVESVSSSLSESDAALAKALVSLLADLHRLSDIQASITQTPSRRPVDTDSILEAPPPMNMFDMLSRQLSDLQIERLASQAGVFAPGTPPILAVEASLLWSRIDSELETVGAMCKQRVENLPKFNATEHLPPQYDLADYEDLESLPDYDQGGRTSLDDYKSKTNLSQSQSTRHSSDEKMRLDLEAVTMAIDRLYLVVPQLHNQRVELKSSKLAELEKASRAGVDKKRTAAKGKERDIRELENIISLIGKASDRTLKDQSVILDGGMKSRLERSKLKESAKRDAFVEQLMKATEAGRMRGQDATLTLNRIKDPEALLTLPEFIREALPASERVKDGNALLTLPEFVREPIPKHLADLILEPPPIPDEESAPKKSRRDRSLSAPPLAWLRSSSHRASSSSSNTATLSKGKAKAQAQQGFDVVYVAENHENLHHTLVFFTFTGGKPGAETQAEIVPSFLNQPGDSGDHLIIKSGPHFSLPLMLPSHTNPGKQEVRHQGSHYEVKLYSTSQSARSSDEGHGHTSTMTSTESNGISNTAPLLDASQLTSLMPTTFICSSCTLPLVSSSRVSEYRDLPSEHWEELVDAWMCHSDQKLHDHVQKVGKTGFWPHPMQVLVGGSYVLFEDSVMNRNNLHLAPDSKHDDNWRLARCLCGSVIGRCQDRTVNSAQTTIFRVLKYAIRPTGTKIEPSRIPLSAYVVEDMMEFVQAHASYRFVIQDEEEDGPRILIWLFKPKIRIAYMTSGSRAIPKSGNILAAKVLFKLIKSGESPSDLKTLLSKYPGFPQAEFLSYPMATCRHIAALLRESNSAYPQSLRMMTGLEVGWLQSCRLVITSAALFCGQFWGEGACFAARPARSYCKPMLIIGLRNI